MNEKTTALLTKLNSQASKLKVYGLPLFVVFIALLYGFLVLRVTSLSQSEPTSQQVDSQVKTAQVLRVDPIVVKQLRSLQDNSVSVKTLFQQARQNPFNN